jgi:fatty acid desaturase
MVAARIAFYGAVAGALTYFAAWPGFIWFWLVPFCTWHIAAQYLRLICEHSAVVADEDEYRVTRTTVATPLQRFLILPRNIGYHIEHHWYPSVPFYRLPELHDSLMARNGFRAHAVVRSSILTSLGDCVQHQADTTPTHDTRS